MTVRNVVAVDLGAESGRVVLGRFDGARVVLEELHRFPTTPRQHDGHLRWDLNRLWSEITAGLATAGVAVGTVDAVGVDTWGVDYGLLGRDGELLGDLVSYRDRRTTGMLTEAVGRVGRERLYLATGIQLLEINTIFQLMAEARHGMLERADWLLLIPDLFHRLLSGAAVAEYTVASTTGAYDMAGGRWAVGLLEELGVPTHLLPEVVDAGTDLGLVRPELPGFAAAKVIAPPSHDTASAVVGVPLTEPDAAYISSGTWSPVGVETREPVINEAAMAANLTNEGGAYDTIRLLRNSTGMWLLQESRRQWAREGREHSYEELVRLAASRDTPIHSSSLTLPQAEADLRSMLRRASAGSDSKRLNMGRMQDKEQDHVLRPIPRPGPQATGAVGLPRSDRGLERHARHGRGQGCCHWRRRLYRQVAGHVCQARDRVPARCPLVAG